MTIVWRHDIANIQRCSSMPMKSSKLYVYKEREKENRKNDREKELKRESERAKESERERGKALNNNHQCR